MKEIKDKLEKRGGLIKQMSEIIEKAKTENRGLLPEEMTKWEALNTEQETLKREADILRGQIDLDEANDDRILEARQNDDRAEERNEKEKIAFRSYILKGEVPTKYDGVLKRTDQTTTAAYGGYMIPQGFQAELEKALLPYISIFNFARIIRTTTGNDIPWPMVNDTSNKGELTTEASTFNAQAVTFGSTTLKAYLFDSKVVTVSLQLLQDSAIPIEILLAELLGERIGRILNQYFTTGTGSSQPQGCAYAAVNSSVTSLIAGMTRADIVKLVHSVNAEYRKNGRFMFADSILKAIKLLEIGTSDDRPLWQPSMRDGTPDAIDGYPYIINDEMSGLGASNKIMLFGDFSKYIIRMAQETTLVRLNELYMANLCVGFISYCRASGHLLNAGTNPIKYLACGLT